jgi:hypothetical protein
MLSDMCVAIAINGLGVFDEVAPDLGGCRQIRQTPPKLLIVSPRTDGFGSISRQ